MSSVRPLAGLVVIEIGHSIAAPYAGMILGELGAEVIKVENPQGGDACRAAVRVSVSIVDMAAGMWSVIGILAAVQERGRTGKGGIVDASLYETALAWMAIPLAGYLADGEIPARHGSGVDMIVPYQAFAASDGDMMVAAGNDNLFRRLVCTLDRPRLPEDPRLPSNRDRVVHRAELVPILAEIFATKPVAHWDDLFEAAGIPHA